MTVPDKQIKEANDAYVRGDFPTAMKGVKAAMKDESLGEEKTAQLRKIRRAIEVDPVVTLVFGVTLFLLIFIFMKSLL